MSVLAQVSSPFKGLAAFEDSDLDALFFFGRERERAVIVANLVAAKLTLLYGPSGVGKSSLLQAGVVRELRGQAPDATVVVRDVWSGDLDIGAVGGGEAYVILDQFEEYFLYHQPDALLGALPELLEQPHAHVLISLREDALAQLDVFKARIPYLFANQIRLEHLDREAARSAIVGPVARWNELTDEAVVVEPELVDAVLDEVTVEGGRIEAPYLQLVLEKLWPDLRLETLRRLGGAATIVRDHLEGAIAGLGPAEQDVAAGMFEHLITPSGTKIAHHAGDLAEYASVPEETLRGVLAALTRDRIVHSVDGSDRYEIFHDVLVEPIRSWRLQRRVERERRIAARRIRRLAAAALLSAVAFAVVAAVALFALAQRSHARKEARHAHAGELAANALASVGRDPVRSLELALSAVRIERNPHVADVLRTSLLATHLDLIVPTHGAATAEAITADGGGLLAGDAAGDVTRYDVANAHRVRQLQLPGPVLSVAFDAHGDSLAAGGGEVVVGHAGRPPALLRHPGLRDASFGDRGREVVTGGGRRIKVWRSADGRLVTSLGVAGPVSRVALSPDGSRVAAAWTGGGVRHVGLFDAHSGRPIADLLGTSVVFSPNSALVATGSPDEFARVYSASNGVRLQRLPHGGAVTDVAFSRDSAQVVTASADGAARVFDVASGTRELLLPAGSTAVETARYSGDGRFIVTGGSDGAVRLWNALNGRELLTLTGHRDVVVAATSSANGRLIASASSDGTVRVWTTGLADQLRLVNRTRGPVLRVGFVRGLPFAASPGGVYLGGKRAHGAHALADGDATGGHLAGVARSGRAFLDGHALRVPKPGVRAAFSPDGQRLLLAGGRIVKLVDAGSGKSIAVARAHARITDARFATDGSFAVGTVDGGVDLFGPTAKHRFQIGGGTSRVVAVAFSPDNSLVAYAARDGLAYVYSTTTARLQHVLGPPHTPLTDVEFSPDGRWVVTAAIGGDVRLYTALDGRLIHILSGHTGRVARVAFSPDGRWLVSAGPKSAGLWQIPGGQLQFYLRGHREQLEDVAFDPTGRRIVTGSDDETLRAYSCAICGSVYDLARLAHARIVRISTLLTPRERRRYLGG